MPLLNLFGAEVIVATLILIFIGFLHVMLAHSLKYFQTLSTELNTPGLPAKLTVLLMARAWLLLLLTLIVASPPEYRVQFWCKPHFNAAGLLILIINLILIATGITFASTCGILTSSGCPRASGGGFTTLIPPGPLFLPECGKAIKTLVVTIFGPNSIFTHCTTDA